MKRVLSLLLAVCVLLSLVACTVEGPNNGTTAPTQTPESQPTESTPDGTAPTDSQPTDAAPTNPGQTDPQPTGAQPSDPAPTSPKPTSPKPTDPAPTVPQPGDIIRIEAEKPTGKKVDTENRKDVGGNPMDHTYRAALLGADGLHYANDEKTAITFSAFDSYTYTFQAAKAGKYVLYIVASCDRDTPIEYTLNNISGVGSFVRNNYARYDQVELARVDVAKGTNTLTVTITDNKNHNINTDCYILVPEDLAEGGSLYDWSTVINAAKKEETIKEQTANPVWKELYVSPDGKDSNDGSKKAPFATLFAANEAVKKLRSEMQGDIIIHVDSGYYPISEPLVIGIDGAGANGYRVIYRGDSDDKPIIGGGVQITG